MRIKKKKKPIGALIVAITLIIYLVLQIGSYEIKVGKEIHENNLLGLKIQEISFLYYTPKHDGEYYEKVKDGETWYWAVLEQRNEGSERLNNAYYVKLNQENRVIDIWKVDLREMSLGWTESKY